jgi:alkylhydroperoxidase family enzyme
MRDDRGRCCASLRVVENYPPLLQMKPIPYKPKDLTEPRALTEAIRARRGGTLFNLDRMLLHSPPLAEGWNGFMRKVRNELSLDAQLREIAICAVAALNHAEYEFHHHAPELLKAGGSTHQAAALRKLETSLAIDPLFNATQRAVIQLAIDMTRNIEVKEATFAAVKAALPDDQKVVELVAVIAAYNMVSRVLIALQVELE